LSFYKRYFYTQGFNSILSKYDQFFKKEHSKIIFGNKDINPGATDYLDLNDDTLMTKL